VDRVTADAREEAAAAAEIARADREAAERAAAELRAALEGADEQKGSGSE
jgi:hypothetical protein